MPGEKVTPGYMYCWLLARVAALVAMASLQNQHPVLGSVRGSGTGHPW